MTSPGNPPTRNGPPQSGHPASSLPSRTVQRTEHAGQMNTTTVSGTVSDATVIAL
jgi:hypothetical protein